jgi:FkbM family methyltransferase
MSVFLPSLKKSGHLDRIHITVCIVGSRKIAGADDYGSQGWDIFAPHLTIYGFDADTDACNDANADVQARQVNWNEEHIPLTLWNSKGKSKLYITKFPGCSSLYAPSESYIERFAGNSELIKLASIEEVDTTTLDAFCQSEGISEIDFIQLDVQGAELQVLEGASWILEHSTLAIVTEVEFTELYVNQPLFSDIDVYLRNQGFTLFDLCNMHRDIRRMPLVSKAHQGALIWSDAFYFRDLIREDLSTYLKTPERILKLACIADVMDFPDYALELLTYLTVQYGNDTNYNFADNIIESIAQIPGLVKQGLNSLPVITKIRDYSSASHPTPVSIDSKYCLNNQAGWQQQAYQYMLLGEYSKAANLYEQAIEVAPNIRHNYWYLGLLLLLQGQEVEAQTTWFLGMAEGEPDQVEMWTAELIQVLQTEAERREALTDYPVAWAIHQHMKEIDPKAIFHKQNVIKYSHLDEESIIESYLNKIHLKNHYCVDIAASDGVTMSNTYFLFKRGWSGLAVEYDSQKFARLASQYSNFSNVGISKCMVTPENVFSLLKTHKVPNKFDFLNLDIDGYDYFVLEQILTSFRPSIICVEINEKLPPPLKFTVKWDSNYVWENDHFYGQSICQLNILCEKYEYAFVELHYNNAFLIPKEISPSPSLTPEEAYKKGYLERPDRKEKFPWNTDIEEIHNLSPTDALIYVNKFFAKYQGKFDCSI